jgi:hypothetical protein
MSLEKKIIILIVLIFIDNNLIIVFRNRILQCSMSLCLIQLFDHRHLIQLLKVRNILPPVLNMRRNSIFRYIKKLMYINYIID